VETIKKIISKDGKHPSTSR